MTDMTDEFDLGMGMPDQKLPDPAPIDAIVKVSYKLPKIYRMQAGSPYQRLFQVRQVVSDDFISLHVKANGLTHHRLGMGVAKKMFRKAVQRNRIKRLIREAFRLERPNFSAGLDIVVRPKVKELSLSILKSSFSRLVPKAERKYLPRQSMVDDQQPLRS